MKKNMLILAVAVFFVGCSESNKNQKFLGLKGNPKSIKETKYDAFEKFGEVIEDDIDEVVLYEFDKTGNFQKIVCYDGDGDMKYSITNIFKNGECIESKFYQKYNDVTSTSNLKNRTSKSETWERKTSDGKITTSYSEFDKLKTTIITKDSEDNVVSKEEQTKDNKGNIIEFKVYNGEDVAYWYKSAFDDKSQEIEKKILAGGYDEGIYTYKYDSFDKKGNWIKKIEYKDGEIESLAIREIKY
ncbi:hypothetical protein M2459_002159 [Parabacteroides sp. PF5-5]|uniref:hypothetical protein n=1 Tax=unclassified Parabacteroides TaxID=2649774 RepID=UPI00247467A7|nr:MULTISPECIES: hypothetical protein [unclassified Parabacteroides]MDH6306825.1 hypothetical protein [Parabacteroides sp. PH5-39]MDH6316270.1 hypothetical protein [Parabacteroides sp. PF5-13]MDH6319753.1 hypothetical protein [Parabacteroides sp. PH5-13]MDH6323655.1 hypothetical protein [Parabacteroides sp. PH5-8]MDH6327457.1 hypothetical protein [Parabacteroides sp. PH5-41]